MATLSVRSMELRHLRYFAAIAETYSFTRAAEQLRISQPALSRQIRDLEDEIGKSLFERTSQGVRPTDAGRRLLRGAKRLLAASEALLSEARGNPDSAPARLHLAHFGPISAQQLAPFLRKLVRRFPHVRLHLDEQLPGAALRRIRADALDGALCGEPQGGFPVGIEAREVWTPVQEILMAADHPLAKRRRVRLDELWRERWGLWDEKACPGFARPLVEACRLAGFRIRKAATPDSLSTIFMHVAENAYISYAPRLARQIAPPGIVFMPTDPEGALRVPVFLVWRVGSPHAAALGGLAQWMAEGARPAAPAA